MPKIPNTDLILTEAEIQAVVDYAYGISMGKTKIKKQDEEEFKIPERFKNIINTGRTKRLHKENPLILQPHQGYYRAEDEF